MRKAWAYATSRDGLRLTPARFWRLDWASYAALKEVSENRRMVEARRWASERAEFANVHFRHISKGEFLDAPWIAEDFLGLADREKRTAEFKLSRRIAQEENLRTIREALNKPQGGGSTRIENGQVIAEGQPNIFARLAEKHEAEKSSRGKRNGK